MYRGDRRGLIRVEGKFRGEMRGLEKGGVR